MDRFIGLMPQIRSLNKHCLKSNMDRFIVAVPHIAKYHLKRLKSNMDRFIEIHTILF